MADPPISKACRGGGTRSFFARSARGFLEKMGWRWIDLPYKNLGEDHEKTINITGFEG